MLKECPERLLKETQLVIFDFDGTLFDIPMDWEPVWKGMAGMAYGHRHVGGFKSIVRAYRWASSVYGMKDKFAQLQNEFEMNAVNDRVPVPSGVSCAKWRLKRGLACSVLSYNTYECVETAVGSWGFYPILTIDRLENGKPNREGVDIILRHRGFHEEDAVFIGNSDIDRETAVNAELPFVDVSDVREEWFDVDRAKQDVRGR